MYSLYVILVFTCTGCVTDSSEEYCEKEDESCGIRKDSTTKSHLGNVNNEWKYYLDTIRSAVEAYKECDVADCDCYTEQIDNDLGPWKDSGVTLEMLDSIKERGSRYQIIDHKLYREEPCMFPSRCKGIEYFLHRLAHRLPDMEMIIDTRDWPQIRNFWPDPKPPLFSFSKDSSHIDIMYPAWSFWEGGPAISLHPTGIGRWDLLRNLVSKAGNDTPWYYKMSKGFFRGSRTSSQRDPLVLLSRENPALVDAQYTKNQAWKSDKDTLGKPAAEEVTFEEHCLYKYLFNFRGVAASFRFKHLFLCRSLVFHVDSDWLEFFYPAMKPWVHYIPVKSDLSDVEELLLFAKENDKVVQDIAERGFQFIWSRLRMDDVFCYWEKLLKNYASLLKFKVTLNKDHKLIKRTEPPFDF